MHHNSKLTQQLVEAFEGNIDESAFVITDEAAAFLGALVATKRGEQISLLRNYATTEGKEIAITEIRRIEAVIDTLEYLVDLSSINVSNHNPNANQE
ncbi:MAG: hypothetical protein CMM47_00615 [Rhodospirillaceae bacterium]|nr:hypothetical protein [Rhodospirillaceae bacterium]MBM84511.1 hypothetical protein [Rhodospirillaceae bacterium]